MTITQNLLKELFDYQDGNLYWKVSKARRIKIGDLAGRFMKNGYSRVGIDGKHYITHRLIFLYHHGYLSQYLDHIDGNPSNNSIDNLRESTQQENGINRKKQKSYNGKPTSSRYKGVTWHKQLEKWVSYIQIGGKRKHLGLFKSEIEAAKTYDVAAIKRNEKYAHINGVQ